MTVTLHSPLADAARVLVLGLATARFTRFVTRDWLGEWALARPARRWANYHEMPLDPAVRLGPPEVLAEALSDSVDHSNGWRSKLVKGLDCPFCVGFWIGGAVLVGEALLGPKSRAPLPLRAAWKLGVGALALNYVVGHVSSKID